MRKSMFIVIGAIFMIFSVGVFAEAHKPKVDTKKDVMASEHFQTPISTSTTSASTTVSAVNHESMTCKCKDKMDSSSATKKDGMCSKKMNSSEANNPIVRLQLRYVNGEITKDQYLEMKKTLEIK